MMNIINSVSESILYCTRNFRRSKILMNNHEVLRWTEPILYKLGNCKFRWLQVSRNISCNCGG